MKNQVGSRQDDYEAAKAEIKTETQKIDNEIATIAPMVVEAVAKVQAAGGANQTLDDVKAAATNLTTSYMTEPNKNFIYSMNRMKDILKNQARMTVALATNYTDLKRQLESANTINKKAMDVVEKNNDDSKTDLLNEQKKHVETRAEILAKVDQYQTEIANKNNEIATLTSQSRLYREETTKKIENLNNVIRDLRDEKAQKETVLDQPDGYITFVDHRRGEVRTNITRGMGARPQMHLTIFDAGSPGIPTEKPKATIELIHVGDRYSLGRIDKTYNSIDPIRTGDIVYSAAWSPNEPQRFALIGKMDVNRDGKDDRTDLIRMIEAAGGIVDYDLPPPGAGKERGKVTGLDAWYVVDDPKDRPPLRQYENRQEDLGTAENADHLKRRSAAIREARDNGVRPMPIGRLLNYLGYSFNAPVRGKVEAIDQSALKNLLRKQSEAAKKANDALAAPKDEAAPKEEEMPKEEAK